MTERTPAATRIASVFSSLSGGAARRVLVVDDEEAIRTAMSKFLRARGYDAVAVDGGAQALVLLQEQRFDALLCDVRMPGMTGVDVVPRALELRPDLAILMLTAVRYGSARPWGDGLPYEARRPRRSGPGRRARTAQA